AGRSCAVVGHLPPQACRVLIPSGIEDKLLLSRFSCSRMRAGMWLWLGLTLAARRPFLPSRSFPHSSGGVSFVSGAVNHGHMFVNAQALDPAPGDPHRALVDAVRTEGPQALAEMVGDGAFALRELALHPQQLFTSDAALAGRY